jgi:hypothetical protein
MRCIAPSVKAWVAPKCRVRSQNELTEKPASSPKGTPATSERNTTPIHAAELHMGRQQ